MPAKDKPKMANKCLLLRTPDERCFFTDEKNYPLLVEFGRTFDAEISVVKTQEQVQVLDLGDLCKFICSQQKGEYPTYDVVEIKLAPPAKAAVGRHEKTKKTREISEHIRSEILSGRTLSATDLESKYAGTSRASLINHVTRIRRELQAKGHLISKPKPGQYRLANELKPDHHEA